MHLAYTACAYAAGLVLDVLVIAALVRSGYRRFPFLLVYVVVDLLTSVAEIRPFLAVTADAILDLGLWAILISSPQKDYRILMIAGGLGIQFTGGAIGQAFRNLSSNTARIFVGDLMFLTNLACLYIWWQALRQPAPKRVPK